MIAIVNKRFVLNILILFPLSVTAARFQRSAFCRQIVLQLRSKMTSWYNDTGEQPDLMANDYEIPLLGAFLFYFVQVLFCFVFFFSSPNMTKDDMCGRLY